MTQVEHSDPTTLAARANALLAQLTLEEKVALMSGLNTWQTVPIERLGIPSLTMTDGPHGVRANRTGPERISGPATSFPTGVSMAASWNPQLIERAGVALGCETRAMGCDILLGPCVNIVRTPLAGRNFEAYAEDPYLAGRIGVAWVKGLQSQRVGASLKHYACNNQEHERFRGDSIVDERTLRETYLAQFEMIVKETQPWTVMCSYNRINGVYASQHNTLQNKILREEWGFQGVIISDWGANHTTVESVAGGMDIEMPGPAKYYGSLLVEAVRNWQLEEEIIDTAVRRILRMVLLSGKMDGEAPPRGAVNTSEHQALARELAEDSITLLRSERQILPLRDVASVAVIGPNATEARIGGGGSSYLEPPYRISPLEGLREALGDGVTLHYAQGCDNQTEPSALKPNLPAPGQDRSGFWGAFYNNSTLDGEPAAKRLETYLDEWYLIPPAGINQDQFSAVWTAAFEVEEEGRYIFGLQNAGTCRLYLDDQLLIETGTEEAPSEPPVSSCFAHAELEANRAYRIRVEYVSPERSRSRELRVLAGFDPLPEDDDRLERAVALARETDVAIVFGGMPQGFESEGRDRPHMRLPGRQDELIRAVAAANSNTVIVLNCGAPVEMPWAKEVSGLLFAYYPGQEGGRAVANILTGKVNPSGRLPITLPKTYTDNPTLLNYPGHREVRYGEGIFVGYRYYEKKRIAPLYPFGFGLSYTTFKYSNLTLPGEVALDAPIEVSLTVTNAGDIEGKEVVQLYIADEASSLVRPAKELKGFLKIELAAGESTRVTFELDARALSFYDPQERRWIAEPGTFEVLIGGSSQEIQLVGTFTLI